MGHGKVVTMEQDRSKQTCPSSVVVVVVAPRVNEGGMAVLTKLEE